MDRAIPKEEKLRARRRGWIRGCVAAAAVVACTYLVTSLLRPVVNVKDIRISVVERGLLEVSVNASGKIVPAFEEVITSPVQSRIVEVYRRGGDWVDVGDSIMRLDLQAAEAEYRKMLDGEEMRVLQLEQLRLSSRSRLSEMEMRLKVSRMELNRKEVELRNELYLDSLGAGTTDRVRQAELSYNVSSLQLNEDEGRYLNEVELAAAEVRVKELELNIFRRGLAETRRTLSDAQIRSPRRAALTYINNEIGAQVGQGSRLAVISDLSRFKAECEIADVYGDRIGVGSRVVLRIGGEMLAGSVSDVTPLSRNGVISFTAQLEEDAHPRLRSGLKTEVYVMYALKEDVMRIANASYYKGNGGEYELFVVSGGEVVRRRVVLGESSFEYVEVVSGLCVGDEVVVSDMGDYLGRERVKLN